jgi:3-deoxy-7-phosphoheptulonate synthase
MIIRLRKDVAPDQLDEVVRRIRSAGCRPDVSVGVDTTVVGVVGRTQTIDENIFRELPWVDSVIRITRPYKLVSREYNPTTRQIPLGASVLGGLEVVVIAGPCSVEGREQILALAGSLKEAGADALRGGAYKPRTSPYAFQGLGEEGLRYLDEARERTGLPVVTEATGTHHHPLPKQDPESAGAAQVEKGPVLENVIAHADVVQIGARNMKSYGLLEEAGRLAGEAGKPVLLKRGEASTLEEFLLAAEYVALHGCPDVILCLRGIRTFEAQSFQRYTSDIAAIAVLKRESNLPVVFDPSHSTGDRRLVHPVALAAVAAGADGLLIEAHADPRAAWSDGQQCVTPDELARIVQDVRRLSRLRSEPPSGR